MAKFKRVASGQVFVLKGQPGPQGINGQAGPVGMPGPHGPEGPMGPMPAHQVRSDEIRFQNPDGTWGPWIRAVTAPGGGGPESFNQYIQVNQASYVVRYKQLSLGTNIFGVSFNGAVEITLPKGIDKRTIIVIKDESGNASANNITIRVET